ncbi:HAD hydrolase-like protein [Clostridium sp. PL3]|uniref:HAD hydrolase-like protein n=1 Tax=Clostridium thailandense TaxID=2794346 RepID=A0A949TJH9_9CLOT|nr:HAD hydrolase-like protein [Clostridium thailandense]MBV7273984.1 HAD hydrolase-like protein [Clostridium thailandense]
MRGVIFNFNGTLFNDFDKYEKTWRMFSKKELNHDMSNDELETCRQLCRSYRLNFRLTSGAVWLFNDLKDRNIPRTITTISPRSTVNFYFENFHLDKWFEIEKIIYDDSIILRKPNSNFYLRAAQAINMPPEDCIIFESTLSGIISAYNAGIGKVIAIAPRNHQLIFEQMKEVYDVIANFHEFDRMLLRE